LHQDVDLEALYLMTEAALEALAASAPGLSRVSLRMCHGCSASGIAGMAAAARGLCKLLVSGIGDAAATRGLVAAVRAARPSCELHW
jgi:hypothetical protein